MKNHKELFLSIIEFITIVLPAIIFYILSDEGTKYILNYIERDLNNLSETEITTKITNFQNYWSLKLIALWIIILIIYTILNNKYKKKVTVIEQENENYINIINQQRDLIKEYGLLKQNLDLIFKHHLISISQAMGCTTSERISLYIVKDDKFIRCARYSQNPIYNKPGRSSYPLDSGVIGQAWANSIAFVQNLPDYEKEPQRYIDESEKRFKIASNEIKAFNMHSRLYLGYRISDKEEINHNGVIVVESIKQRFASQKDITVILSRNRECLYRLIRDFQDSIATSHEEIELLTQGGK